MAKAASRPKQGPPMQFRPGTALAKLVDDFARENAIEPNDACKALVALAANEMDRRYYKIVAKMAAAFDGPNGFTDACVRIRSQLEGARLATGTSMQLDPVRAKFIQDVVVGFLVGEGRATEDCSLGFLDSEASVSDQQDAESAPSTPGRPRRVIRPYQK